MKPIMPLLLVSPTSEQAAASLSGLTGQLERTQWELGQAKVEQEDAEAAPGRKGSTSPALGA